MVSEKFKSLVDCYDDQNEYTTDQREAIAEFLNKGIDNQKIPKTTISNIAYFLKKHYPGGLCDWHGVAVENADDYRYVAYQAAVLRTGDLGKDGGYPCEFDVNIECNTIYVASTEGSRPRLYEYDINKTIAFMISEDVLFDGI